MNNKLPEKIRFYFSGESGKYFHPDDKTERRIKKDIVDYIETYEPKPDKYFFEFRAVDGFSVLALETIMEFIDTHSVDCAFWFRSVFAGDFEALPIYIQEYYKNVIADLTNRNISVRNDIEGTHISKQCSKQDIATFKINYKLRTDSGNDHTFISYFEDTTKDKWIKYEFEPILSRPIRINLWEMYNTNGYINSSYTGIRKQKNSCKYYYRLNIKMPDGTRIKTEKGSFFTAREANTARRKYLQQLFTQECYPSELTFEQVFNEYIDNKCSGKEFLIKKYMSYYNAHLKSSIGSQNIDDTLEMLEKVRYRLCYSLVVDGRSLDKKDYVSQEYISGIKAMLDNVYDYAFNKHLISQHPMYFLDEWKTTHKKDTVKKENTFIEPLFAYLGNKHRLLPDIIKLFPKNIDTFVDAFAGSAVVGININAEKVVINEPDLFLLCIYKALHTTAPDVAWEKVNSIIEKYGLNDNDEQAYYRCRDDYNSIKPYEVRVSEYWYWGLCLVYFSFNRSTVQHNLSMDYNAPFGFKKANVKLAKRKFFAFAKKIYQGNYEFSSKNYKDIPIDKNAVVYLDPPYLIATATYNKQWDECKEQELYEYMEGLTASGIKWAFSNVLKNNGVENKMLREWINEQQSKNTNIHLYYLNSDYSHANFRRKNKGKTVEILLTNY